MKTMKHVLLAIIPLMLGAIDLSAQTATVNLNTVRQTIRGFGGINHPEWYSDLNAAERQLAYGNGPGQLGFTVLRTYVSDNKDNWGRGIETAKYAYSQGAYVFSSPWNPPTGMYITVNNVKRINPATYAQYADHLNSYVTYMKDQGVNLYAISTQNEPDYAHGWTEWSPSESVAFIKGYADRINCKLMTPESFQYRKTMYDLILNDAEALSKISVFGTHLYGTQYADFPYPLFAQKGAGKELWMTEVYTDSKFDGNIWTDNYINDSRHALKVAEHIHYAMVDGNFQTYVFWPLRRYYALIHDGQPDENGSTPAAAGTATKRGYCMAQFSKWVRPGFVRVDATKSPTADVFISAYKKDNDVVIVAVNKNTTAKTITMSVPGTQVTSWENYTTSATKNIAKGTTIAASSSFQVTLDAASVTTFVGSAASGTPKISIVSPSQTRVALPDAITIDAEATDSDGTISNIFYYVNDVKVQEEWVAPYAFAWTPPAAGEYVIKAVATDNDGKKAEASLTITVNKAQGAYSGTPSPVPGKIEMEHYDVGGNGFAYTDNSVGNTGGATFRMDEDVDIENCTDAGTGYNIGYAAKGEWLEYTVDVAAAGTYDITLRVACSGDGRTLSLASGADVLAKDVAIPNTGGWQAWQDVAVKGVSLQAGIQVLRVTIGATDYVNLNYMTLATVSASAPKQLLTKGWNLIGCPLTGSTPIETALVSVWNNVESVKDMNGFYNKSQATFLNSLTGLTWGIGYYVKVNADCELVWE